MVNVDDSASDLHRRARAVAGRTAFLIDEHGSMTYDDLRDRAARIATVLDHDGVAGDGTVLLMSTEPRLVSAVLLGVIGSGRTLAVVDPASRPRELAHVVDLVGPRLLFVDRDSITASGADAHGVPVVAIDPPARATMASRLLGRRKADVPGDDLASRLGAVDPGAIDVSVDPAAAALVLFTSGSTAKPKAVELSRRALAAHLESLRRALDLDGAVIHDVLPLHHADGLIQGPLQAYVNGGTWVRPGPFSVGALPTLLDAIYTHRVTHMITVPTVLALLDRVGAEFHDAFRTDDFRLILSNAAPLGERLWRRIEDQFGVVVCNSYGLTETVTSSLLSGPTAATGRALGTVGKPLDGVTVSVVGADGQPVADDTTGELVIAGDHLFSGYLGDAAATAAVVQDGRFRTGDLARRSADGTFRIVGRTSRMIITGGPNVAPDEVDDVLGSAPSVIESATVGLDDEVWGQRVVSAVTADDSFDAARVLAHCRANLAAEKVPRAVVLLDSLPRTSVGKIDTREVERMLADRARTAVGGSNVEEAVLQLAAETFGIDPAALSLGSDLDSTPGWDSLAHMELVSAVEAHWDIELTNTMVIGIRSIADVVAGVRELLDA